MPKRRRVFADSAEKGKEKKRAHEPSYENDSVIVPTLPPTVTVSGSATVPIHTVLVDDDHAAVEHCAVPKRPDGVKSDTAKLIPTTDRVLVTNDAAMFSTLSRLLTTGAEGHVHIWDAVARYSTELQARHYPAEAGGVGSPAVVREPRWPCPDQRRGGGDHYARVGGCRRGCLQTHHARAGRPRRCGACVQADAAARRRIHSGEVQPRHRHALHRRERTVGREHVADHRRWQPVLNALRWAAATEKSPEDSRVPSKVNAGYRVPTAAATVISLDTCDGPSVLRHTDDVADVHAAVAQA